jgi:hypothetical protein
VSILAKVVSLWGCLAARLYSAPIGANNVAIELEKLDPDCSRAGYVSVGFLHRLSSSAAKALPARLTLHGIPEHGRVLEHLLACSLDRGELALASMSVV